MEKPTENIRDKCVRWVCALVALIPVIAVILIIYSFS